MTFESVLITGGTGLIGSHLAGHLTSNGHKVTVLSKSKRIAVPDTVAPDAAERIEVVAGDMADPETLEELVKNSDAVFHKAASVGMAGAVESARDYVGENLSATANLVDVLRSSGSRVKKVILGSSISVYGEGNYLCKRCGIVRPELRYAPMHPSSCPNSWNPPCPACGAGIEPSMTAETADRNGESIYAVTRKAQEDLLIGSCRQLGIPLTILRYSTVLGPGQSWHNPFTRILEMIATGEAPTVHEDGRQTRDFIFIQDLVEVNLRALKHQEQLIDIVNVSAIHVPLIDFIKQLSLSMTRALGVSPVEPLIDGRLISADVRHCHIDCTRLKEELKFVPKQKSEESIASLVNWFIHFKGLDAKKQPAAP